MPASWTRPAKTPQQVVEVNLLGTMNTMGPAIDLMRASGGGRIAVTTSMAAFRPQPKAPAYAASKAAVQIYAEGMRTALHATGIELRRRLTGIVATPMVEGHQVPVRFLVSADRAAEIIVGRAGTRPGPGLLPLAALHEGAADGLSTGRLADGQIATSRGVPPGANASDRLPQDDAQARSKRLPQ